MEKTTLIPIGILAYLLLKGKYEPKVTFADPNDYPLKNPRNSNAIATLHPKIRDNVYNNCLYFDSLNLPYLITEGYRTFKRQRKLHRQNITPADAGQSYHDYGLAFDIYLVYDSTLYKPGSTIISRFKNCGYTYGGDWNNPDPSHFQKTFGLNWRAMLRKVKDHKTDINGYITI